MKPLDIDAARKYFDFIRPDALFDQFFSGIPGKFTKEENEWSFVPVYYIFGSEEMSSLSPAIKERIPEPALLLNPEDAAELKLQEGYKIEFESAGQKILLSVKIIPGLPEGIAGYPFGFKGIPFIDLNGRFKLNGVKQ